jgi:hypothetical protein
MEKPAGLLLAFGVRLVLASGDSCYTERYRTLKCRSNSRKSLTSLSHLSKRARRGKQIQFRSTASGDVPR